MNDAFENAALTESACRSIGQCAAPEHAIAQGLVAQVRTAIGAVTGLFTLSGIRAAVAGASRVTACFAVALLPLWVQAQSATDGPGLLDSRLVYANDVERAAALANQRTFDALDPVCNPGGQFDQVAAPAELVPPSGCSELQFFVYLSTRELVHSANALLGEGPTVASLNVDQRGLGTALRWTAAEELAVQGSMATQFSNNQLANLASRLTALRFGTRGFTTTANAGALQLPRNAWGQPDSAGSQRALSSSANAPSYGGAPAFSRWGGFLNVSVGSGDRQPTGNENAFDFDSREFTLGLDYRLTDTLVVGGMLGYSDQSVDFDGTASRISVVGGGIEGQGENALLFGLFNGEQLYASVAVGAQRIDYELTREIRYPSFNPDVPRSDSVAISTPEADITTVNVDVGYSFGRGALNWQPYLGIEYADVQIDAFNEARSFSSISGLIDTRAFNLVVDEQSFRSTDTMLGLRVQYTMTPAWGVAVPYVSIEYHREFENDPRLIRARYAGAGNEAFAFDVRTDPFDSDFFVWSVGVSAIVRGARSRTLNGPAAGGVSVFTQYQAVERLDFFTDATVSAGIRYEF